MDNFCVRVLEAERKIYCDEVGEKIRSPINGKPALTFPRRERFWRQLQSYGTIAGFCCVIVAVVAVIFAIRGAMQSTKDFVVGDIQLAGIIASIINSVQIMVFNSLFSSFAIVMNDYENYRTGL